MQIHTHTYIYIYIYLYAHVRSRRALYACVRSMLPCDEYMVLLLWYLTTTMTMRCCIRCDVVGGRRDVECDQA